MLRRIALALAMLLASPSAYAQGINLAWNNCLGLPNAAANIQYACDGSRNGTPFRLVASFTAPAGMNAFIGVEMKFRIQDVESLKYTDTPVTYPPLTDWWRLGMGECRQDNLIFPTSLTGIGTGSTGSCRNPWLGAGSSGGGYSYDYPDPSNPNKIEIFLVMGRDGPLPLTAGQHYIAGVVNLDTFGDHPSGSPYCAGCCEARGILFVSALLYEDQSNFPVLLTNAASRQYVFWQDEGAPCPTPARRSSWGSIKASYR